MTGRAPVHHVVDAVASTGMYTAWLLTWQATVYYAVEKVASMYVIRP